MELDGKHLTELKEKMEQAKTLYLKYVGAVEVVESLLATEVNESKIIKKDKKVKK